MSGGSSTRLSVPGGPIGGSRFSRMKYMRTNSSRQAPRGRMSGGGSAWHTPQAARACASSASAAAGAGAWPDARIGGDDAPEDRADQEPEAGGQRDGPSGTRHGPDASMGPPMSRRALSLVPSRRQFLQLLAAAGVSTAGRARAAVPIARAGARRSSRKSRRARAASPGSTRTRCRRIATCRRRWGPASRSSTTTTTAGPTSSWSTAARSDFYTPKAPLQERALPEQPRRHVHRRHREGGRRRRRGVRHGLRDRGLRQRRLPGHPGHRVRPVHAVPQQRQRHLHRRHREGRRRRLRGGRRARSGSTTTTTAGSISSCAASSSSR